MLTAVEAAKICAAFAAVAGLANSKDELRWIFASLPKTHKDKGRRPYGRIYHGKINGRISSMKQSCLSRRNGRR